MTHDTTRRDAALEYAARGWAVLPLHTAIDGGCSCGNMGCPSPGKHPMGHLVPKGLHQASHDAETVAGWWAREPLANVGIATGALSGLLVLDLDDRPEDGRDGRTTWHRLLAAHHAAAPETVEATTGGGGRHLLFALAPGDVFSSTKDRLGPGLEVKADGGYIVAPPSAHRSGREYTWDGFAHPDDTPVAPIPDWLRPLLQRGQPRDATRGLELPPAPPMDALEVAELGLALAAIPSDDRDVWLGVGMALHDTGDPRARGWWDEWSATSEKFDPADSDRVWASFGRRADGRTIATIYAMAHRNGWERPPLSTVARLARVPLPVVPSLEDGGAPVRAGGRLPVEFAHVDRTPVAPIVRPTPLVPPAGACPLLGPLPAALASLTAWTLATAPSPVPLYAAASALALGSVLSARRFATSANNFSSLYLLVIGKSGTGKEHCRTAAVDVLHAVGAPILEGPNAWTSASAVFAGLLAAPQQLAIVDEFGQFLGGANGGGDSATMRDGVLTQLMELFGRLHGRAQSPQYATLTMSKPQRDAAARQVLERPGLTLLGMTTPAMWWAAMRSQRVASGFLNRFLPLDASDTPRGGYREPSTEPVPPAVVTWGRTLLAPRGDLDLLDRCTELPDPVRLQIDAGASRLFAAWRDDCNQLADALEVEGLGELPMRAAEIAMRLALIGQLADHPGSYAVGTDAAAWGIDVARWSLHTLVPQVRERLADSPLAALRKQLRASVMGAGERGLTQRDITRLPGMLGVSRRDRDDAVAWLLESHRAAWVMVPPGPNGGRPRRALVSTDVLEGQAAIGGALPSEA